MPGKPLRGEIWMVDLAPTTGHEQGGKRPCLVLSDDVFNQGPAELVVLAPLTSRDRQIPLRLAIDPPEGGLTMRSFVMPEMIRSVSVHRLSHRLGSIRPDSMSAVETRIRVLLSLE